MIWLMIVIGLAVVALVVYCLSRYNNWDTEETALFGAMILIGAAVLFGIGFAIYAHVITPSSGTVVDKQYHAAYTSESCTTVNKSTICTPQYHPQSWDLDLHNGKLHGWVEVDETTYHKVRVGQFYDTKGE